MKFVISVDAEGVACAVGAPGGSLNASSNLAYAIKQMAREADAAARGLFDAGATQVIVIDAHGSGVNMDYDLLDKRVDIVLGSDYEKRLPGVDETFAGLLLVGYHAMDNTSDAVIAHTFNSSKYQSIKANGREIGEMAVDAAVAGRRGVPLIFVSSDDKGVAEAKAFFPWVGTVQTKLGLGWNAALSKHPVRVCEEIHAGVQRAVSRRREMQIFELGSPIEMEVRYKRLEFAQEASRCGAGWERVDAYTVCKRGETIEDFY
jgi:D-amino peptidase